MGSVVIFHHVLGATEGLGLLAARVAEETGVPVTIPDFFEGEQFATIDDGVAHVKALGFGTAIDRAVAMARDLEAPLIVAGFSLGVLPAQKLAQTDDRVVGAFLVDGAIPLGEFAEAWPASVALRIHMQRDDPWSSEDVGAARDLVAASVDGALRLHEGSAHLAADSSAPGHSPDIAEAVAADFVEFVKALSG